MGHGDAYMTSMLLNSIQGLWRQVRSYRCTRLSKFVFSTVFMLSRIIVGHTVCNAIAILSEKDHPTPHPYRHSGLSIYPASSGAMADHVHTTNPASRKLALSIIILLRVILFMERIVFISCLDSKLCLAIANVRDEGWQAIEVEYVAAVRSEQGY